MRECFKNDPVIKELKREKISLEGKKYSPSSSINVKKEKRRINAAIKARRSELRTKHNTQNGKSKPGRF